MVTFGLVACCQFASAIMPKSSWVVVALGALKEVTSEVPGFLPYSVFGLCVGLLSFAAMMLMFRFLWKPDVSKLASVDIEAFRSQVEPMDRREKVALSVLVGVFAAWAAPTAISSFAPALAAALARWGLVLPPIVGVALMCLVRVDGEPVLNFGKAITQNVSWSGITLIATTMLLTTLLPQPEIGFSSFLAAKLSPLVVGLSPMVFVLLVSFLTVALTNIAANNVIAAVMASIALPLAANVMQGVDVVALAGVIGSGAGLAFATPPSTALTAIAVSGGWIDVQTMLKYGVLMALVATIVLAFCGYPVGSVVM